MMPEASLRASFHTKVATDAMTVERFCVFMPKKTDFSDCVARARLDAFPASCAFARIEFGVMSCFVHVYLF